MENIVARPFARIDRPRRNVARLPTMSGGRGVKRELSQQKKAAWLPRRPFLSYGGPTLTGDFRTWLPGAYLPADSYSGAAANRDSRELEPEPYAMVSHLRKMGSLNGERAQRASTA